MKVIRPILLPSSLEMAPLPSLEMARVDFPIQGVGDLRMYLRYRLSQLVGNKYTGALVCVRVSNSGKLARNSVVIKGLPTVAFAPQALCEVPRGACRSEDIAGSRTFNLLELLT